MSNKFLSVGSDPEVFLRDNKGAIVSAIDLIPGSKSRPYKTTFGSVQPDNILAEFNSIPSTTREGFISNHKLIIDDLINIIKPLDLKLDFIASALCEDILLSDPRTRIASCIPDYNAWDSTINPKINYDTTNIRAAGGHLHIAFDMAVEDFDYSNRLNFVRTLDLVLGVPSVLLDKDTERRNLYGKAGAFRPKDTETEDPYMGVEYRTLSNFWLKSEGLMGWAFDGVKKVYENLDELKDIALKERNNIVLAINTSNKSIAEDLCERYSLYA